VERLVKTATCSNTISEPKNKSIPKIESAGSTNFLENLKIRGNKAVQTIKEMQIGVYGMMYFG